MRVGGLLGGQLDHDAPGIGTRKPPWRRVRRALERALDRHRRARLVLAQRVLDVDHVRGRRDVGHVAELADQLDVVEHLRELAGEAVDLLGRELEAGESGDVEDLIAAQHQWVMLGAGRRGTSGGAAPGVDSSRSDSQLPTHAISAPARPSQAPSRGARGSSIGSSSEPERDEHDSEPAECARRCTAIADRLRRPARDDADTTRHGDREQREQREQHVDHGERLQPTLAAPDRDGRAGGWAGVSMLASYHGRNSETSSRIPPRPAIGSALRISGRRPWPLRACCASAWRSSSVRRRPAPA